MTCAVDGCEKEIPASKIMCVPHWSAVPKTLKEHIWVLYSTKFGPPTAPWTAAVRDAAQAVLRVIQATPTKA